MRTMGGSIVVGWLVALTLGVGWLLWVNFTAGPSQTSIETTPAISPSDASVAELAALKQSVNLLSTQVATLAATPPSTSKKSTVTTPSVISTGQPREFIISLGGAATSNRDWTTTAAEITLDPSKYAKITGARWEAAGSIVGGELAVRLVDVTHSRIYYEAVLIFNSSSPTWKRSPTITLANTPALYRLEIKSSSGEMGQLNDSRLVIETQ